jgi:hypothetical protein
MKFILLTVLIASNLTYYLVNGVCCHKIKKSFNDRCGDGTKALTPYCGYGPCNIFGCNCDGGCRKYPLQPIEYEIYGAHGSNCISKCQFDGYYWCKTIPYNGFDWDYCSPRENVNYQGQNCVDKCDYRGEKFKWCHDRSKYPFSWGYCGTNKLNYIDVLRINKCQFNATETILLIIPHMVEFDLTKFVIDKGICLAIQISKATGLDKWLIKKVLHGKGSQEEINKVSQAIHKATGVPEKLINEHLSKSENIPDEIKIPVKPGLLRYFTNKATMSKRKCDVITLSNAVESINELGNLIPIIPVYPINVERKKDTHTHYIESSCDILTNSVRQSGFNALNLSQNDNNSIISVLYSGSNDTFDKRLVYFVGALIGGNDIETFAENGEIMKWLYYRRDDIPSHQWEDRMKFMETRGYNLDVKGYLVDSQLGGPNHWYNLVPQTPEVKRNLRYISGWINQQHYIRYFLEKNCGHIEWLIILNYDKNIRRPKGFKLCVNLLDHNNNILNNVNTYYNNQIYN